MRPTVLALAALLTVPVVVVAGGVSQPSPATAAATTVLGSPGLYKTVVQVRALDTRRSGSIPAQATARVRLTGVGQVPTTGVVAVSVNLSVLTPASSGSLSAFADGTRWSGAATMSFQAGRTNQNFETVPVSAAGLIDIRNNSGSPLTLVIDILGYHAKPAAGVTKGLYQPMSPTRLLDTRTSSPVASGQTRTFQVGGRAGIPPQGDSANQVAVVVNFTVLTPSRSGSLTVGTANLAYNTPSLSFAAGRTEQSQLLMGLDSNGAMAIHNNSGATIQVIADVVGYYTGITQNSDQEFFAADGYGRAYDSRTDGQGPVPPGGTVVPYHGAAEVQISATALGWGSTPPNGLSAGSINVTVLNPTKGGSLSVRPAGTSWNGTATISFEAGQTTQRMLMAQVGYTYLPGDLWISNNSTDPVTLIVDLDGWSAN